MNIALLAETASHAAGEAAFPPFQTWHMPSQLFWLAVLFTVLYLALSRYILPKMTATIEGRSTLLASDLDEAARLNNQAIEAQKTLELQLAQARAKARETADQARQTAEAELSTETARVEADLATRLEAAEARISKVRADAMNNVEQIAVDTASVMLGRLGVKAPPADLKKAVSSALEKAQ